MCFIAELPMGDPIMRGLDPKTEAGKMVNVECIQSGSYPAANFTWFINGNQVSSEIRLSFLIKRVNVGEVIG